MSFIFFSSGYYYEVESYRSHNTVKKRFLRKFGKEDPRKNGLFPPPLSKNAPSALILFAGGGGVEAGMVMAGIRPAYAIEHDEKHLELSDSLVQAHHTNFSRYQSRIIEKSVTSINYSQFQNIDFCHASPRKKLDKPGQPQKEETFCSTDNLTTGCPGLSMFNVSPVCSNFSKVNSKTENLEDFENALAIARCVAVVRPKVFTLENVGTYANSLSLKMILTVLEQHNYQVDYETLNMANYGVAQSRVRFWLRASLTALPHWPETQNCIGFWSAIQDIANTLSESKLTLAQIMALEKYERSVKAINYPIVMERVGYRSKPTIRQAHEPFWTIRRMICTDQNDNNWSKFADLVLADGMVLALDIECLRRLQGFPLWYQLPEQVAIAGSLLGYSVPPVFAKQLFEKFVEG